METNQIIQGDALEELKKLEPNSVDSIVTDPPYGLSKEPNIKEVLTKWINKEEYEHKSGGFMGKSWDNFVPNPDIWKEVFRVLKPGGHALVFSGTRTSDLMAISMRMAGFKRKDTLMWVFGSGFPKSHNIRKNIEKQIDNFINSIDYDLIWKKQMINLKNVNGVEKQSQKNKTEAGKNIVKRDSVLNDVLESIQNKEELLNAKIVENLSLEANPILKNTLIVLQNVEKNIQISKQNAKFVVRKLLKKEVRLNQTNIFIVQGNVRELLKEKIKEIIKEEGLQKIWLGKLLSSKKQDLNVLCAELIENLKHTILNQLKISQNLDIKYLMDNVFATNVIITKSTMECLISFMGDILKEEIKKYEGEGTHLKPAFEPILLMQKPTQEKNIALNVLKYGTGGLNIDGCRIRIEGKDDRSAGNRTKTFGQEKESQRGGEGSPEYVPNKQGRFPSNLILDEEAGKMLDKQSGNVNQGHWSKSKTSGFGKFGGGKSEYNGVGRKDKTISGASRFFYTAKASKGERNKGLEDFEEKESTKQFMKGMDNVEHNDGYKRANKLIKQTNNHPTVKPIQLMRYLVRLVTPKGGTVLDPFAGSGSTLIACKLEGMNYIGIEKEEEYVKIAKARIKAWKPNPQQTLT